MTRNSGPNNVLLLAALLLVCATGRASAQSGTRNVVSSSSGGGLAVGSSSGRTSAFGVTSGGATVAAGSSSQAATAAESVARGRGEFIRSLGAGQLHASEALINVESAKSRRLDNKLKKQRSFVGIEQARQELRDLRLQYRREEMARRLRSYRASRQQDRSRIQAASLQIDDKNGDIVWPSVLRVSQFASIRYRLDELSRQADDGDSLYGEIAEAIGELNRQIRTEVRRQRLDASGYVLAKRFVRGLQQAVQTGRQHRDDMHMASLSSPPLPGE